MGLFGHIFDLTGKLCTRWHESLAGLFIAELEKNDRKREVKKPGNLPVKRDDFCEIFDQKGGFNIFRRFRITYLQKTECPEVLRHFWSGHAPKHVSERYTKLREERDFRLEWAEKIGLGFELPPVNGQLGQLRIVPKVA
jgi:hypothetical protein